VAVVELSHRVSGSGPLLVLVHGAAADADSFRLVEPMLARDFTVVTVDRRGRRGSPDEVAYSIEREFDDLVGPLQSFARPAALFGHSFGGNVALGAALRSEHVTKVVAYEPGHSGDMRSETLAEFERLFALGDWPGTLALALREFAGFPEEHVAELLEVPAWRGRMDYAHTVVRELRAYRDYDNSELGQLDLPTLLLVGGETEDAERAYADSLAQRIPGSRVRLLEGQGHIATFTAPALLAEIVSAFVLD
jgi:pimeloyl-ACP methyl ester carboxylesterase